MKRSDGVKIVSAGSTHPATAAYRSRSAIDVRTVVLLFALWGGIALAYEGHRRAWLPGPAAVLVGLLAMNLAFTVWHEGIHQTISRRKRLNHLLARLGAFPVFIPYSRLQTHHLLHHRYTNVPDRDPDYWQVRGSFWTLPLRYRQGERESRALYMSMRPPRSAIRADRIQIGLAVFALAALAWLSVWSAVLAIVIPRLLLIYTHSFYVNYLPHARMPVGKFLSTRFLLVRWIISVLMVRHNYHALHHAYPSIPWHRYRRAYLALKENLAEHGIPSVGMKQALELVRPRRGEPAP